MIGLCYVIVILVIQIYALINYSIPKGISMLDGLQYLSLIILSVNYIIKYFVKKRTIPKPIIAAFLICFVVLGGRELISLELETMVGFFVILPLIYIIIRKQLFERT